MNILNIFKSKYNSMFYGDALEVLPGIRQSLEDCSKILSASSLDDYYDRFKTCGDAFETVIKIINSFLNTWERDEYNVCNTLKTIREYIAYYMRLCDCSSPSNYNTNKKYMVDSIHTVSLAITSKVNYLVKTYQEHN